MLKDIVRSPFVRLASLNGAGVLLKIVTGLVSSKLLAVIIGPSGIALLGNMRNFATALETMSTLGFQNGIIREVASGQQQKSLLSTIFISVGAMVAVLSLLLFCFSVFWAEVILGDAVHSFQFRVAAFILPFYAFSFVLLAVLNGLQKYRNVVICTMAGNVIALAATGWLAWHYETQGALAAVLVAPALLCFVAWYFVNREIRLFEAIRIEWFDAAYFRGLLGFSIIAFFSAIAGPLVFLALRNYAIDHLGKAAAGHWATMEIISTYCFLFVGTLLTLYFFPKLAAARENGDVRKVVKEYLVNVLPLFGLGLIVLYCVREFALKLLFSREFLPVAELFSWQLAGDFLKAASLIFGYILLAQRKTVVFIVTECLSLGMNYVLGCTLLLHYGKEGLVMAHFFTYAVYLVMLIVYYRGLWKQDRLTP